MSQHLLSSSSQQAALELEMLQRRPGLELLVTAQKSTGGVYVAFVLPLFADTPQWDVGAISPIDDAWSVYLPDAFNHPNATSQLDNVTLSIVYSLHDRDENPPTWRSVSVALHWPENLKLSRQVTHTPAPTLLLSSVEVLSSCQQVRDVAWHA